MFEIGENAKEKEMRLWMRNLDLGMKSVRSARSRRRFRSKRHLAERHFASKGAGSFKRSFLLGFEN